MASGEVQVDRKRVRLRLDATCVGVPVLRGWAPYLPSGPWAGLWSIVRMRIWCVPGSVSAV